MTKEAQKLEIAMAALREVASLNAVCDHDRGGPAIRALMEIEALDGNPPCEHCGAPDDDGGSVCGACEGYGFDPEHEAENDRVGTARRLARMEHTELLDGELHEALPVLRDLYRQDRRTFLALLHQEPVATGGSEVVVDVTRSIRLKPLPPFTEPDDPA